VPPSAIRQSWLPVSKKMIEPSLTTRPISSRQPMSGASSPVVQLEVAGVAVVPMRTAVKVTSSFRSTCDVQAARLAVTA
jgi:hypothetical protein